MVLEALRLPTALLDMARHSTLAATSYVYIYIPVTRAIENGTPECVKTEKSRHRGPVISTEQLNSGLP